MFAADECETTAGTCAAAADTAIGGRRLPLSSPSDATYLSSVACLMRSQLEIFSATEADVKARASFGRLVQKISVGRVGIRCIHCRDRPAAEQAKGAVSYPTSIRMLNQATRNWQRYHWVACPFIPATAREEFQRLTSGKRPQSSKNSQEYWIRRSGEMGLVDTATEGAASSPDYDSIESSSGAKGEQTTEPDGIHFEDDARKLGLCILMPPVEEKASGVTTKRKKKKGKEADKKGRSVTHANNRTSNKRKNTVDNVSQITSGANNASTCTSEENMDSMAVPSEHIFPAMHSSLSIDDFADDVSLLSGLQRLAEEDESGGVSGTSSVSGSLLHQSTKSDHTPANDSVANGDSATPIDYSSFSERDLQLLSFVRAAKEMVRTPPDNHRGASATGVQVAADLHSLGTALYRTLTDEDGGFSAFLNDVKPRPKDGSDERTPKRDRRRHEDQPAHGAASLQDLGYPTSISIFVQSLIDATNGDALERFTSISGVDSDLRLMIEFPDKYLFDSPPEVLTGRLRTAPGLYGIQTQQSKLMNAFKSVVVNGEERSGLALISGRSGSGKTSLVETLSSPLKERRGRLIQIKFDREDNQSLSAIFRALDRYCQDLQGDLDLLDQVGGAVKVALGPSAQVLLSLMPNLSALVGEITSTLPSIDSEEKYRLLLTCLQTFVRAISAPTHPTVILFDDLQWIDMESLDLITKFVKDAGTTSCLFVGCYRDNEVQVDHPLLEYLSEIAFAGVPMWQIFQETIDKDVINELLSDTLHLLPRITAPLAREIHKKTGGNPHFAKQLLQSLNDEQLLQYSPSARRWQWDINTIRSKSVPDNAVALLLERMTQYGPNIQRVLRVSALVGRRFDASALKMFEAGGDDGGDGSEILVHIDTLIDDGLVCIDKAELRFAHDSIWEAAISLTPVVERESMHLLIGRQLLRAASTRFRASLDVHLHLIVDQMNFGSSLIEDRDEKLRLAELNLQIGQETLAAYSFLEASSYLLKGGALLSEKDWDSNYKLCLDIFTACAEAQFAHGDSDGAISSANVVILHGRTLNDKLSAHFIINNVLYTQGKVEDAGRNALSVLEELGIQLPPIETRIEAETVRLELEKTERLSSSLRLGDVMARPLSTVNDNTIAFTMRFLFHLCRVLYVKKPDMMTLVVCRMVQITMEGSMTSEASIAFGTYSSLLCNFGFRDRSAVCAQIASALPDRFCGKYSHDVFMTLIIAIQNYRQPWHACLDSLESASRDAEAMGDVENTLQCYSHIPAYHIFTPTGTLQDAREKLNACLKTLTSCGHPLFFIPVVYLQTLLNLTSSGTTEPHKRYDPTMLQGDATNQKNILSVLPQSNMYYKRLARKANFARLYLGYLFRRHDVVLEMASNVKEHLAESKFYPTFELLLEKFYLGLAAYSIVRRGDAGDTENWRATADELTTEMKVLSENDSKWNFEQKYFLLEAERAFTDDDMEAAATAYDKAIEAAKEHRFINEQALASERAALFYLEHGNIGQARRYLEESRDLYDAWGAKRKVEDIDSWIGSIGS